MAAVMIVSMTILDESWIAPYFAAVPAILAEYGAVSLAGSRDVRRIEGDGPPPERMAVLTFPSLDALDRFMADERYRPYRAMREAGSRSEIFVFENAVTDGALV